ncbi:sulfotransferase family 2 domain-containing protein [Tabrizicola sp.]|uniref:sulfotransferase family 2 domain-containing protein n=1 Tax=Tabrizicola sp. TaxID=2005166 RepID=UPI003F30BC5D
MPIRLMRHAQGFPGRLAKNPKHRFAINHSMALYGKDTVFTFIPKNGCSSLRYSAALSNQVIDGPDGIHWIAQNNASFSPSLGELVTAKYTFVVLRCPFRRVVSCFLNLIIDHPWEAQKLRAHALQHRLGFPTLVERGLRRLTRSLTKAGLTSVESLTFADFVTLLEVPGALQLDIHWRPQVDFLVYRNYDDIFRLEEMDGLVARVKEKADFTVLDTRALTLHGNEGRERIHDGFFGTTTVAAHRKLKQEMKVPAYESLYDPGLYDRVGRLYREDIELYLSHFGRSALLQLQETGRDNDRPPPQRHPPGRGDRIPALADHAGHLEAASADL